MEISQILDGVEATVTTDLSKKSNNKIKYLRTLKIGDQEFFIAKDFANLLGYAIPEKAIRTHCDNSKDFKSIFNPSKMDGLKYSKLLGNNWKNI